MREVGMRLERSCRLVGILLSGVMTMTMEPNSGRMVPDSHGPTVIQRGFPCTPQYFAFSMIANTSSDLVFSVDCGACLVQCNVQVFLAVTAKAGLRGGKRVSRGTN